MYLINYLISKVFLFLIFILSNQLFAIDHLEILEKVNLDQYRFYSIDIETIEELLKDNNSLDLKNKEKLTRLALRYLFFNPKDRENTCKKLKIIFQKLNNKNSLEFIIELESILNDSLENMKSRIVQNSQNKFWNVLKINTLLEKLVLINDDFKLNDFGFIKQVFLIQLEKYNLIIDELFDFYKKNSEGAEFSLQYKVKMEQLFDTIGYVFDRAVASPYNKQLFYSKDEDLNRLLAKTELEFNNVRLLKNIDSIKSNQFLKASKNSQSISSSNFLWKGLYAVRAGGGEQEKFDINPSANLNTGRVVIFEPGESHIKKSEASFTVGSAHQTNENNFSNVILKYSSVTKRGYACDQFNRNCRNYKSSVHANIVGSWRIPKCQTLIECDPFHILKFDHKILRGGGANLVISLNGAEITHLKEVKIYRYQENNISVRLDLKNTNESNSESVNSDGEVLISLLGNYRIQNPFDDKFLKICLNTKKTKRVETCINNAIAMAMNNIEVPFYNKFINTSFKELERLEITNSFYQVKEILGTLKITSVGNDRKLIEWLDEITDFELTNRNKQILLVEMKNLIEQIEDLEKHQEVYISLANYLRNENTINNLNLKKEIEGITNYIFTGDENQDYIMFVNFYYAYKSKSEIFKNKLILISKEVIKYLDLNIDDKKLINHAKKYSQMEMQNEIKI